MRKDNLLNDNPHKAFNNRYEPADQDGQPLSGSKKVKQANHSRQIKTREG
ncbi:small acid-soluble spore protein P [Brevibacillus sp. SYP-B805]|nr:small acid-soluble spore protein P [Brevibacillus sp. SYP-B805]NGQ96340.1 small acid-soluble spore protein P [Brevibacillus sp. SYP-B805]